MPPITPEKTIACSGVIWPRATGRMRVRAIFASICRSMTEFTANAAPASSQMPAVATATEIRLGNSWLDRNMPITAQKMASWVTRGLVSSQYWRASCCQAGRRTVSAGTCIADGNIESKQWEGTRNGRFYPPPCPRIPANPRAGTTAPAAASR
jgi:hypothetical protein